MENGHDYDITYTAGSPVSPYFGRELRPEERPPVTRAIPDRLMHLRDGERARFTGDQPPHVQYAHWTHGVPPLRPAPNRGDRRPSRGGRRYADIYLAEDEYYAGDIAVHFDAGESGCGDIITLRPADFLALQAAVTDPAKPVTARQVREHLQALLASDGPLRDGWDPADAAALHRVLTLLEES